MDLHHVNRIEIETSDWNFKEERLRKLFKSSSSINNSLSKEKLKWCENILIKYGKTNHLEERSTLQIIKAERSNLIKLVYPNRFRQIFYKLINLLILEKVKTKILISDELKNNRSLEIKLRQAGFNDVLHKVERYMRLGQAIFTVPVSYYINEKERIDHALQFKRDELGYYQFEGFRTSLNYKSELGKNRNHYFSADEGSIFNATQSYNLLSGRAILINETWKQFDLNDKDANDNYLIKEFPESYGYSLEKVLSQLPIRISVHSELSDLISLLKDGRREEVILIKDGADQKVFIEADPHRKFLNIYNENLKKVFMVNSLEKNCDSPKPQKKIIEVQENINKKRQVRNKIL
jgi:hypothetical protein